MSLNNYCHICFHILCICPNPPAVHCSQHSGGPERPDWMNTPPETQQLQFLRKENQRLHARIAGLEERLLDLAGMQMENKLLEGEEE